MRPIVRAISIGATIAAFGVTLFSTAPASASAANVAIEGSAVVAGAIAAAPAASAATRLGGIDLQRYCTDTAPVGWVSKIVLVENHARGWRCQDSTYYGWPIGWVSVLRGLDLNQACRMQYGEGAYAVLEQNHAQGWKCYR